MSAATTRGGRHSSVTSAGSGGGPLSDVRVIELAGIGPGPHAAMVLADLGADVVRVERPPLPGATTVTPTEDIMLRNRRRTVADLKCQRDVERVLTLVERADVLIEGFRPGVTERLGVGPDPCLERNPSLVYGRMTGWGQLGPRSRQAGHDINYIGLSGVLHAIGRPGERPLPPLNLVGDYGGGSMLLVVGVLAALLERHRSGRGQVVDAAMVDGASLLAQGVWTAIRRGEWSQTRGTNVLDGGAPFYDVYACADGRFVAVGALEEPFYEALLVGLELDRADLPPRHDRAGWPRLRACLAARFALRTRDEWLVVFDGTDACVTPVLAFDEAAQDPHILARGTLIHADGTTQAAAAPRFSRSPPQRPAPPSASSLGERISAWQGQHGRTDGSHA